jgi:Ulp1 family protease
VKRWTKKLDIFEKDILVFPINAFKHWFCLLVLNPKYLLTPTPHKCQLIYCDSMLERKEFVVEAIRRYLEIELEDKKTIRLEMSDTSLPCHQLLVLLRLFSYHARPTPTTADYT